MKNNEPTHFKVATEILVDFTNTYLFINAHRDIPGV